MTDSGRAGTPQIPAVLRPINLRLRPALEQCLQTLRGDIASGEHGGDGVPMTPATYWFSKAASTTAPEPSTIRWCCSIYQVIACGNLAFLNNTIIHVFASKGRNRRAWFNVPEMPSARVSITGTVQDAPLRRQRSSHETLMTARQLRKTAD